MGWLQESTFQGGVLGSGAVLVWALALYVASRAPSRRAPVLAALAMLCLAAYLTGEALGALAPDPPSWSIWLRRTWWATSLAAPAWLVLTLALATDEGPGPLAGRVRRLFVPAAVLAFSIGVAFGLLGTTTLLVQDWNAPFVVRSPAGVGGLGLRHHPPGPLLALYQLFVLVCLLWSTANLALLWRRSPPGTPLRARFGWLSASAVIFLLGGAWIVIGSGGYMLAGWPGQALLVLGMVILGWNMARYGALLAGERVLNDFLAFAATMLAIVGVYGAILLTLAPDYAWLERGLPLLLLVMTTHVLVDTRGHLLDRMLYAPVLGTLRGQLRELGNRVVRQPDALSALVDVRETVDEMLRERSTEASAASGAPPSEVPSPAGGSELRVLVEGALRHLNDLPSLSQHTLLFELPEIAEMPGTPLERAAGLRQELEQAIDRLRPPGARPSPGGG
ncbi:MAG: histidine kinase N-terminal 7TM domain-containing protein, partial [Chloroflexota bacterium]